MSNSDAIPESAPTPTEAESAKRLLRPPVRPTPPPPPPETPKKPAAMKPTVVSVVKAGTTPPAPAAPAPVPDLPPVSDRQQPIPAPSEPKQYRAIGLLRGTYVASEEQFTKGTLMMPDGTPVDAVLLGRVMSLVKNHLDLESEHLWVVYPRTSETDLQLHVQIVGVWEPETLSKEEEEAAASEEALPPIPSAEVESDYFSIRGEVVFYSPENRRVVVKIQQAPRKESDRPKAFKLQISGTLEGERTLNYFWDLHVKRVGSELVVDCGTSVGLVPPKKRSKNDIGAPRRGPGGPFKKKFGGGGGGRGGSSGGQRRPVPGTPGSSRSASDAPMPKPVKRTEKPPTEEQPPLEES